MDGKLIYDKNVIKRVFKNEVDFIILYKAPIRFTFIKKDKQRYKLETSR
jgi:hypothetical protein